MSNPALKVLQDENKDDDHEFFDLKLNDNDFDTTMHSAVIDFNNMSVNSGCMLGNNNTGKLLKTRYIFTNQYFLDNDDDAAFNMAQVLGQVNRAPGKSQPLPIANRV